MLAAPASRKASALSCSLAHSSASRTLSMSGPYSSSQARSDCTHKRS
jgi:hypothetical protein